ncbi:MAG: hypothetical protein FWC73_14240 [Defluviitaleaceae bacterium]|nr:hypothetical protein [Defluviitaleaceae bacterium]
MKKKLFAVVITLIIVLSSVLPAFAGHRVVDSLPPYEQLRQACIIISPGIVATRGGPGGGVGPPPGGYP